jgi:hypothetical protein
MFAEVISQIATLFEDGTTVRVPAFEIKLDPHCFRVPHFDSLMPRSRNALEGLGLLSGRAPQLGHLAEFSLLVDETACFLLCANHVLLCATLTN